MKLGNAGRTVKVGIIGLGCRSESQLAVLLDMPDVEITYLCDVYEDRVEKAAMAVEKSRGKRPECTQDYHMVNRSENVEAVVIMTSWQTHTEIAVDAMLNGKIPGMEVGGASDIEECWRLVRTSEATGIPVMLLENCCYNNTEMALLNMIRQGVFGELYHLRGGYQHDLRDEIGNGDINRHYRQDNFLSRCGELYPTHELGPIAKYIKLNDGNRMVSLVSMASKAVSQHKWMEKNRQDSPLKDAVWHEGDVVTTLIKCLNGETIVLTHDCTSPRPYSRGGYVQGTGGVWEEDGRLIFIDGRTPIAQGGMHSFESDKKYMEEYEHPLWKEYREFGLRGGHDGMDYLTLRAFIESIQKNVPFPIDVYDAASWMAVTCLSEQSIAAGSSPVSVPDFTLGKFMNRTPRPADIYSLDDVHFEKFE